MLAPPGEQVLASHFALGSWHPCSTMPQCGITRDVVPWNLLQDRQERQAREVEPADEEPKHAVVTAGLQQTSLHHFGQAALRTTVGTDVTIAGPVKRVEDADLPFVCRFCLARFKSSQGRHQARKADT